MEKGMDPNPWENDAKGAKNKNKKKKHNKPKKNETLFWIKRGKKNNLGRINHFIT